MSKNIILFFLVFFVLTSWCSINAQNLEAKDDYYDLIENISDSILDITKNDIKSLSCLDSIELLITGKKGDVVLSDTNKIKYTPHLNQFGLDTIYYRLKSCLDTSTSIAMVIVNLIPINQAPICGNTIDTLEEEILFSINVQRNTSDRESENLTTTSVAFWPNYGGFSIPTSKNILYSPVQDYFGNDSLQFIICDNYPNTVFKCCSAWSYLYIKNIDDTISLIRYDTLVETTPNREICIDSIQNIVIDPDKETSYKYTIIQLPKNGEVSLSIGKTCFIPKRNFRGLDSFLLRICDSNNNCQVFKIKINVKEYPYTIEISDTTTIQIGDLSTKCIQLSTNSPHTPFSYSLVNTTSYANLNFNNLGCFEYLNDSFLGTDSFRYVLCDNGSIQYCDTFSHYIKTIKKPVFSDSVTILNSFSPNYDGVNDFFVVQNIEKTSYNKLLLFNKLGDIIYQTENYQNDWDGNSITHKFSTSNSANEDVYFYIFEFVQNNIQKILKGFVYIRK